MIRGLTVSLLFAVLALPAYAQDSGTNPAPQDNPQTRQTDQSEDDYRRSQRRRDTGDIFEDIGINTNGSGTGGTMIGREIKAIDRLNPESRRHLNKERAKALAMANPGEPIDAAYNPSEAAKADEYVAKQEEAAWEEMLSDANSGLSGTASQQAGGGTQGQGQGQDQGSGQGGSQGQPAGQAGQAGGQSGQSGQSGGQAGQAGQAGTSSPSPLRGGSASSASAILDRIKGRTGTGSSPQGQSSQGQSSQGQSSQGQAPQGQSPANGQAQAEAQAKAAAQAAAEAQARAQAAAEAAAQAQAAADQNRGDATSTAEAKAQAEAQAQAAMRDDEPMSPLDRLKRDPVDRGETGGRTSASDYLRRVGD